MNLDFLAIPMGMLVKLIYNVVSVFDTKYLSAYSISIIISTIVFKLLVLPLTLKQTKSMKKLQELNPKLQELQKKYGKDPQTFQRKQLELYKEANYSPFSGCLPLLIQFPILIAFFYVIRSPEIYVFKDQAFFDTINKTFLWIKDLGFAENHVFENGVVNGISMGSVPVPFIGSALPVLAAISGFTTYLTSKMTAQPAMNEQQESTQRTMSMMMPVMIFLISVQFPAGLGLYWVVSNIFQFVQQYLVLNSSKNPKEELK